MSDKKRPITAGFVTGGWEPGPKHRRVDTPVGDYAVRLNLLDGGYVEVVALESGVRVRVMTPRDDEMIVRPVCGNEVDVLVIPQVRDHQITRKLAEADRS